MRTREFQRFLKKLLTLKEQILTGIDQFETNKRAVVRDSMGEVSDYSTHPADMGAIYEERERNFTLAQRERKLLDAINEAIERIHNGSYGVCERCGGKIDFQRLNAIPYAKLCIRCKEEIEQQARR